MSSPSRPRMVRRALRSPLFAALASASAASSGLLKDCCALAAAAAAITSIAAINKAGPARNGTRCGLLNERIMIVTPLPVSSPDRGSGRKPRARSEPLLVGLEFHAELVVEDSQVAVAAAHDRVRHDGPHLLRHDADIGAVAAVVGEAIEAEAVVEMAEQDDVVLERNIGPPAAAAAAAATATTAP